MLSIPRLLCFQIAAVLFRAAFVQLLMTQCTHPLIHLCFVKEKANKGKREKK